MTIIKKLWAGGYSLPKAFWGFHVIGIFLAVLLLCVILIVAALAHLWTIGLPIGFVIFWAYWIVSVVGVWRSAGPYVASPGSKQIWGWIARGLVCVWTLRAVWGLVEGVPALVELMRNPPAI